ncbi:MAG: hypothetical protein CMK09_06485 [Ponticaulis sp.]|nr:hypothetical protein [Ponticaulis sp.]
MSAHPKIEVVHQILKPDRDEDLSLFNYLIDREETTIPIDHPLLAHRQISEGSVLLLKNAVWCHSFPRNGFILVRNPFSISVSAFRDNPNESQAERQKQQQFRWAKKIDPRMTGLMGEDPTLTGFLALYSRKMLADYKDGLPFVRYEDFIGDPETFLKKMVLHLGLAWDESVLRSHENYKEGEIGHGGIKLWQPIHQGSLDKYKGRLTPQKKAHIYGLTHEALEKFGYEWNGHDLALKNVSQML